LDSLTLQDRAVFHNLALADICSLNTLVVTAKADISNSYWHMNNRKTF